MKRLILGVACIIMATIANAQNIEKGYHGMVEAGYSVNTGGTISVNWTEINTTHGFQATPNFFIGAGVGFHFVPDMKEGEIGGKPHWKRDSSMEIPLFADFRWTS